LQPQPASDEQAARLSQSLNESASEDSGAVEKPLPKPVVAETPTAAVSPPPEPQPRPSRAEPRQPEPISYWELPQGVRDTFSEIRITVLVYSENASERFVLINGQRLVEKDELQGGIVLDEIRRGGAVFLYRKYRFLVKG
jgi:general secretion pathway protein B